MKANQFKRLCDKICLECKIDCCKKWTPFFSEYDKKRLRKINKSENLYDGNLLNTKNKRCPFYDRRKKLCLIHNYRPLDCRLYPYSFWFEMGRIDLWLDLKCSLSKSLIKDKKFYRQAMRYAKSELIYWSEGEIFGYLMAGFDIEKFKRLVRGKRKFHYYKETKN
ncbi:MAG: YkgJ family cysteine cluster protein [Patescibacteria group bacterium]